MGAENCRGRKAAQSCCAAVVSGVDIVSVQRGADTDFAPVFAQVASCVLSAVLCGYLMFSWLKKIWLALAWTTLVTGLLALLGVWFIGQRWHWLAFLMHLPPHAGVLGILMMAAGTWWWRRRGLSIALLLLGLFIAGPLLGWRSHGRRVQDVPLNVPQQLRVMSCNRGQHHEHDLKAFLAQVEPDVLLIQDAFFVNAYKAADSEYKRFTHRSRVGELVLLSRHPIMHTELVRVEVSPELALRGAWHRMMRATLRWGAQPVVIYSMHLPSPRHPLEMYRQGEVFTEQGQEKVLTYWQDHAFLLKAAVDYIEADMRESGLPTLVMGDLNLPQFGPLYRQLTRRLQDTHSAAGQGYGFTCPADLPTRWAARSPWLRIDYILADSHWEVLAHQVEAASAAQHAAVSAVLRLR
jgi:endonuclease/exonuclease/phosphatase family metal-dependent hydrolase